MTTAKDILIAGLKAIGADGLHMSDGEDSCGCGIDDLAPCCSYILDCCEPAKQRDDGLFYAMEEQ